MTAMLLFAACLVAAPQAKAEGRITVWLGDKIEHFKPDGSDVQKEELPDGYPVSPTTVFTPDRKASVVVDVSGTNVSQGIDRGRLIVAPRDEKEAYFVLEGYVILRAVLSADGSKVYFVGDKADELPRKLTTVYRNYYLDLSTKSVAELKLPDKHTVEGISPDGKAFVTAKVEADLVKYTRQTFLTPAAGGEPAELFAANVFPSLLRFSPDGKKLLARRSEFEGVFSNGKGGFRAETAKPREYVVVDVATRKETKLPLTEDDGPVTAWDWSPDGKRIVYLRPAGRAVKVFVADADGANAKEIYQTAGKPDRAFVAWGKE